MSGTDEDKADGLAFLAFNRRNRNAVTKAHPEATEDELCMGLVIAWRDLQRKEHPEAVEHEAIAKALARNWAHTHKLPRVPDAFLAFSAQHGPSFVLVPNAQDIGQLVATALD